MKKILIITGIVATGMVIVSCGGPRRNPGRAYMPDMNYSRAYETYASTEALQKQGVNYNARPVEGTVARGDMFAYTIKNNDSGYAQSASIKNPLDSTMLDMKESERLYLVNCGICHGTKLDGQGPLYNNGKGPFPVMPRNLVDDAAKKLAEGTMFHVITYGKGMMGSYASQLSTPQRWMVIRYIKSKQGAGMAGSDSTAMAKDTVSTGK
jgi:mono/diheme cytochrome c family protein